MVGSTYNFIIPSTSEFSIEQLASAGFSCPSHYAYQGEFIWGHQTYHILKERGLPVMLSSTFDPSAINLAHGNVLRSLEKRSDCFCVSLQADFPHYPLAHFHIVQNKDQETGNAAYIPHWPQPDLVPRNPQRRELTRVVYQGARNFTDLDEETINNDLRKHGITFSIYDQDQWRDLSEVDVLVGIRSYGRKQYKRKPPTKLINAWHAGIPFIGGWDSAYSQVGTPERDYIRVASYEEMLEGIVKLKNNPDYYNSIVEEGRKRAASFSVDAIAQIWIDLLEGSIDAEFQRWSRNSMREHEYRIKSLKHGMESMLKGVMKQLYRIRGVKRLRDRYYDPLK